MANVREWLIEGFKKIGKDHHDAFLDVGGADPDWAHWYAKRTAPLLNEIMNKEFGTVELASSLEKLDKKFREKEQEISWHEFYADFFLGDV